MNKCSARRLVVDAFKEASSPAGITGKFSTSVPGNGNVPPVAGVNRPTYKVPSKINAGGVAKLSGPPKGLTPTVNLKATTPTSVSNVSEAAEVNVERLEKESTVNKTVEALNKIAAKLIEVRLLKQSVIHDVDTGVKGKQKETKPEVVMLESASDEKPKKAPEKKPEPKTSENEIDMKKDAAGKIRRAISVARDLAGKAKRKGKPTSKARAKRMTSQAQTSAAQKAEAASNKALQPIVSSKPKAKPRAKSKSKAAPAAATSAAPAQLGMSTRNKILAALGASGVGLGAFGAGSALASNDPGQSTMAADPSVLPMMMSAAQGRGTEQAQGAPYDWGTAGNWLQDIGSGGMGGIGSILSSLGLPGAKSLTGWAGDPKTSQLVGAGGMTIGTILAIMLLRRLLGGSGER